MRVIGYIRVSSDDQARTGVSLATQRHQLQKYCELHGHELVDVLADEGVSASVPVEKRAGGAELMMRLRAEAADGVVIQRLDRLFRLGLDSALTGHWFRERGLDLMAVQESIDLGTKDGWLSFWIRAGIAEYERMTICERARETSNSLRERRRPFGAVPFGLMTINGELFRDPADWPIREAIVRWREEHGETLDTIAKRLDAMSVPTPANGRRGWSRATVRKIVQSHGDYQHIPPAPDAPETPDSHETPRKRPYVVSTGVSPNKEAEKGAQ